jgi:glucose/arabinose dehydrogenase
VTVRRLAAFAVAAFLIAGCRASAAAPNSALDSQAPSPSPSQGSLVAIGAGLQGPAGLNATVYAMGLEHPAAFAFDSDGRLWVATADYSDDGTDGVYLIAAAGATPRKVIGGLHTPLGLLWLDGSLYVSSRGGVVAWTGFDGSAFAGHRAIVTLPSGTGEVNGMALAPNGRIWMGISAASDHATGDSPYSATVVSFRPDGTDLKVEATGIRAPIGLAWYPGTADLFVTMNQRDDLGDATPGDWLAIVASGQNWGFPDCYGQGGTACDGVPQPVAVLDEHAAVSGLAIATGQLGPWAGNAAIVAEWATGKVLRVPLAKGASGYASAPATTFITGLRNPVALAIGPDGALYAGDWTSGIVYRIGVS